MGEPIQHQVHVDPWVSATQIGQFYLNGFVICRGCGSAVPMTVQPALKAHLNTCEPLRRTP